MRSYSIFTVFLLCILIVLVDVYTFFWLKSISQLIVSPVLKTIINILFWTFSIGLVSAILLLKIKMESVPLMRRQLLVSSLYGLTISSLIPKIIFSVIISILFFTNYVFSETESLIIVPIVGLISGFLRFFIMLYYIFASPFNNS